MNEENVAQVINNNPSNVPLYVFSICFGIWAYVISLNENSWSPKWDDLLVYIVILIPMFFIAKCTISGNCGVLLTILSISVLIYSFYSAYKNMKKDDTVTLTPAPAPAPTPAPETTPDTSR